MTDEWGNIIDEVCYSDSEPWPTEADGKGAFLQLIDLDLDNSLPENWTIGYSLTDTSDVAELSENDNIMIYPNPANDKVYVEGEGVEFIEVYNAMGQKMMEVKASDKTEIDINAFESGMYMLRIIGKETTTQTIIKK